VSDETRRALDQALLIEERATGTPESNLLVDLAGRRRLARAVERLEQRLKA
jgi:hypothetical protein